MKRLYQDLKDFLLSTNYKYESDIEKKINEIVNHLNENHNTKELKSTLEKLNQEVDKMFEVEFIENRNEILTELKVELASRYLGNVGAIKERLFFDNQFNMAIKLLKNDEIYAKLLTNDVNN